MAKNLLQGKTLAAPDLIEDEGPPRTADETLIIPLEQIHPSPFNPYNVNEDSPEMEELAASIRENGLLEKLTLRHRPEGGYEIISGHRRLVAMKKAGLTEARAEIKDMDDAHAKITMGQYNKYRTITPMEKARDYKQQMEGYRELIETGEKSGRADFAVADMNGVNHSTIQNYLRLNYLIKPLQILVDKNELKITPAFFISYLSDELQADVQDKMDAHQKTPSRHQAMLMRDLYDKKKLDTATIEEIFSGRYKEKEEKESPPSAKQPEPPIQEPPKPAEQPIPASPAVPSLQPDSPPARETEKIPPAAVPILDLINGSAEPTAPQPQETPPTLEAPPPPEAPPEPDKSPEPEEAALTEASPTEEVKIEMGLAPEELPPSSQETPATGPQPIHPPFAPTAEAAIIQIPVNEVRRYFKQGATEAQMRERLIELAKLDYMKQRNQHSR